MTDPVVRPVAAEGYRLEAALAALRAVLGNDLGAARGDTPLAALGADPLALVLWADTVEATTGLRVDDAALARAANVDMLVEALSGTMTTPEPPGPRPRTDTGGTP